MRQGHPGSIREPMGVKIVQKLRVRIGEYERLEEEDRFLYILAKQMPVSPSR